jgi:hypothetical protein
LWYDNTINNSINKDMGDRMRKGNYGYALDTDKRSACFIILHKPDVYGLYEIHDYIAEPVEMIMSEHDIDTCIRSNSLNIEWVATSEELIFSVTADIMRSNLSDSSKDWYLSLLTAW